MKILIADDENLERSMLRELLETTFEDRCQIYEAENGRKAVQLQDKEGIKIFILDIEMPGVNGLEAAKQMRDKDPNCSIIFLTAFDEFDYVRGAVRVNALDYLLKPYEANELILVVERAMQEQIDAEKSWIEGGRTETAGPETNAEEPPAAEPADAAAFKATDNASDAIIRYIKDNYSKEISLNDAAKAMGYSEAYFCRLFKQYFGKCFTSYLTEYRIGCAKDLLKNTSLSIWEVGCKVGYTDSNYFTRVFKRVAGVKPTEYRKDI